MTRTRILLAVLVMVICLQLFPQDGDLIKGVAVGLGALYCLIWGALRYRAHVRRQSAIAAQQSADDAEYRLYKLALDDIRSRHDSERDLADPTSISPAYQAELNALHDKHEAMLTRKFSPGPRRASASPAPS